MIRLFIAFPIESAVKKQLAAIIAHFKQFTSNVKWVEPKNMHLTARFLGDTDPKLTRPLVELVEATCQKIGPVEGTIERLGGFPNLIRPRVLWAGLDNSADRLIPIVKELQTRLVRLGLSPDEKRFNPHLTLGRIRQSAAPKEMVELFQEFEQFRLEPIQITFDRLELIQSTLTPQGPVYKTLGAGRLAERFS